MTTNITRRAFTGLLGLGMTWPFAARLGIADTAKNFRIRTITAGLHLQNADHFEPLKQALVFLQGAQKAFQTDGYEVQTLRMATQPLLNYLPDWKSPAALRSLQAIDRFAVDNGVMFSIGPVITDDRYDAEFAPWAAEVVQQTNNISFTMRAASAEQGIHRQTIRMAAETIQALATTKKGGEGNFRFAATAFVPAGSPFFPAAYYQQSQSFSIGLESPNLLSEAFEGPLNLEQAKRRLKAQMEAAFTPVAKSGQRLAHQAGWQYLGIDASPAPGLDASIGQAIETLTHKAFGSASTLAGCAAITDVLKGLELKTCGYSGLMLPVLEDPVLAQRAAEGRYGVAELLLYSSVCGTGLDVVPLPGDTTTEALAAVIGDMAALATKYRKALSARLFPMPGKRAGEMVSFDNPFLTETMVMSLD